jgi:hypothetical protein
MSTMTAPPGNIDAAEDGTLVRVYNRFLIDMLLNLKSENAGLKKALSKAAHKAIDPTSDAYVKHALSTLPKAALVDPDADPSQCLADPTVLAFEPLSGVSFGTALEGLPEACHASLRTYVYILASLTATYGECLAGDAGALACNVIQVLARVQVGDADDALDGILDEDIACLLERVGELSASAKIDASTPFAGGDEGGGTTDAFMKAMENSKIADLAKEISKEIDVSQIKGDNPMDLLNFANLGDSNSVLGSIVGKVGSKIQSKLATGELKHEDLLAEAVSMLKMFDGNSAIANNPLIGNMLNAAQSGLLGGVNTGATKTSSARERLRQKLAKQAAAADKKW